MAPPYLQSCVSPVITYEDLPDRYDIKRIHGTAALVGPTGEYITAAHVLREAEAACVGTKFKIGVAPMVPDPEGGARSQVCELLSSEDAPTPYDIAVFRADFVGETRFKIWNRAVDMWKDCAALGYPSQAVVPSFGRIELQARGLKGYVQRFVPKGRAERPGHPDSFEVSFPITRGMSGSPLFLVFGSVDILVGICVGSHSSEIAATDIEAPDPSMRVVRLEEFGWVHDIRPLIDWTPSIFGTSLGQLNASSDASRALG